MGAWQSVLRLTPLLVLFGVACQAPVSTATPTPRLNPLEAIGIVQEELANRPHQDGGDCLSHQQRHSQRPFEASYIPSFHVNEEDVGPVWQVTHVITGFTSRWFVADRTGTIYRQFWEDFEGTSYGDNLRLKDVFSQCA